MNHASDKRSENLPLVFLNHVYIVLDAATYEALEQSAFLRQTFAVTEQRTTTMNETTVNETTMNDRSYTALYLYGVNTYLEFFDAANLPSPQMPNTGIAFGVDQAGALRAIGSALSPNFVVEKEPATRRYGEKQVPWFYAGAGEAFPGASSLPAWLMEYHPRFLAEWHPQPDGSNQGVSRQQILQRYAAVLGDAPASPYFEDVVALTVAVDESARRGLLEFCELLGYRKRSMGTTSVLNGPDLELFLIPQTGEVRGVQEIAMRVRARPRERTEFCFGPRATLRFQDDGLAIWMF